MIIGLRLVLVRDVRIFFSNFYGVGFRSLNIVLETVLFAYILTRIVPISGTNGLTYLQYYALGSIVISVFWASYSIGRDVFWDKESGYMNYLMTLPISRTQIILGRSLGGSLRGIFSVLPLYALASVLVPTTALNILESVGLLFIFSMGLCGLGITIALSVREETKVLLLNTLLSLTLIRASTAMYPATAMPVWLQVGTRLNPLTYTADSIRSVTTHAPGGSFPVDEISIIVLFTVLASVLGSWIFSRMVEGGSSE